MLNFNDVVKCISVKYYALAISVCEPERVAYL